MYIDGTTLIITMLTILLISLVLSIFLSYVLNNSLHKKQPHVKSYKWGYFYGYFNIFTTGALAIMMLVLLVQSNKPVVNIITSIFAIICFVINVQVVLRNRHHFILATILNLNPVIFIVNGIYIYNRWVEMGGSPIKNPFKQLSLKSEKTRVVVYSAAFWALTVFSFVLIFEPYGTYMSNKDWWHVFKVIFFPPLLIIAGDLLYIKTFKKQEHGRYD